MTYDPCKLTARVASVIIIVSLGLVISGNAPASDKGTDEFGILKKIDLNIKEKLPLSVFSGNGKFACVNSGGFYFTLYELPSGKKIASFNGHEKNIYYVHSISPDGRYLIVDNNVNLRMIESSTLKKVHDFSGLKRLRCYASHIKFSPDGKHIVVGSYEQDKIYVFKTDSGKVVNTFDIPYKFGSLAYSPDNKFIIATEYRQKGKDHPSIRVLDANTGEKVFYFTHDGGDSMRPAFRYDGSILAAIINYVGDNPGDNPDELTLWDMTSGEMIHNQKIKNTLLINPICSYPKGPYMGIADSDNTITIWDIDKIAPIGSFKIHNTVYKDPKDGFTFNTLVFAMTPDGKTLAATNLSGMQLWDISSLKSRAFLENNKDAAGIIEKARRAIDMYAHDFKDEGIKSYRAVLKENPKIMYLAYKAGAISEDIPVYLKGELFLKSHESFKNENDEENLWASIFDYAFTALEAGRDDLAFKASAYIKELKSERSYSIDAKWDEYLVILEAVCLAIQDKIDETYKIMLSHGDFMPAVSSEVINRPSRFSPLYKNPKKLAFLLGVNEKSVGGTKQKAAPKTYVDLKGNEVEPKVFSAPKLEKKPVETKKEEEKPKAVILD